jgi:hypothetical protein
VSTTNVITERQLEDAEARVDSLGPREAEKYLLQAQPHLHEFVTDHAAQASARLRRLGLNERLALAVEDVIEKTATVITDALRPLGLPGPAASATGGGVLDAKGASSTDTPSGEMASEPTHGSSTSSEPFDKQVVADHVRFLRSAIGVAAAPPHARMVILRLRRKQGIEDLTLRQPQALRLLRSLAKTLAEEGYPAASRAAEAIVAAEKERARRSSEDVQSPEFRGGQLQWKVPSSKGRTDQLVHRELLLHSRMRVRLAGPQQALSELAQAEPALARYIIAEFLTALSSPLGGKAAAECAEEVERQAVIGALALVMGIRRAYAQLWADTMVGSRLARIDPSLRNDPDAPLPEPEHE